MSASSFTEFISLWIRRYCAIELRSLPESDGDALRGELEGAVQTIARNGGLVAVDDDDKLPAFALVDLLMQQPCSISGVEALQKLSCLRRLKYTNWSAVAKHVNTARTKPTPPAPKAKSHHSRGWKRPKTKEQLETRYVAIDAAGEVQSFEDYTAIKAAGFNAGNVAGAVVTGTMCKKMRWYKVRIVEVDQLEDAVNV